MVSSQYYYVYRTGLHQQKGGNLISLSSYENCLYKLRKAEIPVLNPGEHHMKQFPYQCKTVLPRDTNCKAVLNNTAYTCTIECSI